MSAKSVNWIRQMAVQTKMIQPFVEHQAAEHAIPFGLNYSCYIIRSSDEFLLFAQGRQDVEIIDPKNYGEHLMTPYRGKECIIPPKSFAIIQSLEYIHVPENVLAILEGHPKYLLSGFIVPSIVLEPGWSGNVKFALFNSTSLPGKLYANQGIAYIWFLEYERELRET